MEAFADRAARELRATGQPARKRTPIAEASELTPQEAQAVRHGDSDALAALGGLFDCATS